MKNIFIVTISVTLSVIFSVFVTSHRKLNAQSDTVQVKHVEIRDSTGRVRIEIGMVNQSGREIPQMVFWDEYGNMASLMTVSSSGNGSLYFNGNGTEGKVTVGYLWGSDGKVESKDDPFGSWGVRILGRDGLQTAVGISNTGNVITPNFPSKVLSPTR